MIRMSVISRPDRTGSGGAVPSTPGRASTSTGAVVRSGGVADTREGTMRALALAASAFLLAAAPSPAQREQQPQQEQRAPAAIAEAHRRLEQAFNRGDAAAVAALYTEDAILLPPGADIQSGRRSAQARWRAAYDT